MEESLKMRLDAIIKEEVELYGYFFRKTKAFLDEFNLSKDANLKEILDPYFSDEKCEFTDDYPYNEIIITPKIWINQKEFWKQREFIKWYLGEHKGRHESSKDERSLRPAINEYCKNEKVFKDELTKHLDKEFEKIL